MTWTEIRELCNGKTFVDRDGIECRFVYEEHPTIMVAGDPTPRGKRTAAYRATKRELGDDWSTDLASSPEAEMHAVLQIVGGTEKLDALVNGAAGAEATP